MRSCALRRDHRLAHAKEVHTFPDDFDGLVDSILVRRLACRNIQPDEERGASLQVQAQVDFLLGRVDAIPRKRPPSTRSARCR